MIINSPIDLVMDSIYLRMDKFIPQAPVYLKLEGLNLAGSIKLKTAIGLIQDLQAKNCLKQGSTIIESSSGNLGVALSMVCKQYGYKFICVTDPNISRGNLKLLNIFGAKVVVIREKDENGGYLRSRIDYIRKLLIHDPNLVWTNQYANVANKNIHKEYTAQAIFKRFKIVDYLFVGAGTTGTLMGCAEFIAENNLSTKLIAVDSVGSVTFGSIPKKRHIPGIGTSRKPELVNESLIDDVVLVSEVEAISMCHKILSQYNLLIGGSTGSVLAALSHYSNDIRNGAKIVAISPDLGERYIDTLYDAAWIKQRFGIRHCNVQVRRRTVNRRQNKTLQ